MNALYSLHDRLSFWLVRGLTHSKLAERYICKSYLYTSKYHTIQDDYVIRFLFFYAILVRSRTWRGSHMFGHIRVPQFCQQFTKWHATIDQWFVMHFNYHRCFCTDMVIPGRIYVSRCKRYLKCNCSTSSTLPVGITSEFLRQKLYRFFKHLEKICIQCLQATRAHRIKSARVSELKDILRHIQLLPFVKIWSNSNQ